MTNDSRTLVRPHSWEQYWGGTGDGAAYSSEGAEHPALVSFWRDVFASHRERAPSRIVDIACGNGSLEQTFLAGCAPPQAGFLSFDISVAAVSALVRRFPAMSAFVADARAVPLPTACGSLVVSQFGIEYAGEAALAEALRLVAPGGTLALLLHHRDGVIFRDCAANLDAVESLRRAEWIARAGEVFGPAGSGPARPAATQRMASALRGLEGVLQKHGPQVAGGAVIRFYNDAARLLRERPAADAGVALIDWFRRMDVEFAAYVQRMAAMCAAALSRDALAALCRQVARAGLHLSRAEALGPAGSPLAWAVVALRPE